MSLKNKSAADIQAIIDAALAKKPALPKGLAEEIQQKEAALKARKASKEEEAAKEKVEAETKNKTIEKTLGKAKTVVQLAAKSVQKKINAAKASREKKLTIKAAKKGQVAVVKKKRLDALQKLRLKEERRLRRLAKRSAAENNAEDSNNDDEDDDDADSELDAELLAEDDEEENDNTITAVTAAVNTKAVIAKTICGGADKDALADDPLAATFATFSGGLGNGGEDFLYNMRNDDLSFSTSNATAAASSSSAADNTAATTAGNNIVQSLAAQKASEYIPQETLLGEAHKFFSVLSENDRKRNALARRKIAEMKAINKRGGDKEGFKYVLPTSVKSYARQLAGDGNDVPENLDSHFLGDGVQDTMKAPSRKKEKKRYHDDFYSFQVAKKWTRNAENFLKKANNTKNMFISRQQKLRTTKKM